MRKYFLCLVILLAFVTFAYAKGPDMSVMSSAPSANIIFPHDSSMNESKITNFEWELVSGSGAGVVFNNCSYTIKRNSVLVEANNMNCINYNVLLLSELLDGNYSLKLYANYNDSDGPAGNNLMGNSQFLIDTLPPQISITSPADNSNNGIPVTQIDYVIIETNLQSCWFTNGSINDYSIPCVNGVPQTFVFENHEGNNNWTICAKDIVGHETCDTVTFWVDSITPLIEFTEPTTASGNYSQNSIWATVTASDTNLQNIIINLYDSTGLVASQSGTISPLFRNFTGLGDGTYYLNATVNDAIGHMNQTETRTIMLDTTAPVVTLISPYDNQPFAFDQNITFNFNVNEANPYTCDLILNGNIYQTNFSNGDTLSLPSGNQYTWNIQCIDSVGNSNTAPESNTFTVLSDLTFPNGTEYTNLTNETDISSVYFWIRNGNGSIYWTDPIDMSRGAKWSDYITLEFNKAKVDTTTIGAYEFKDKKANITLYNISWNSPQILRDSEICSSDICTELLGSYVANVSYMFNVTSFSTYETRETLLPSYGVSGGSSSCKTNWTCTAWSTCFGNVQIRTCTKVKLFCNTYTDKPAEKQSCIEQKSVNTTQIQQAPEQPVTQPQGGTGITGFITAHPASTAATLIAILGVASYFVVSRIRTKSLKPEPAKTGGKEGVSWITSKSAEKVDSI
jgi:hypothetical protein